jgi:hypothetical protein
MLRYVLFLLWVEIWLFLLAWGLVVLAGLLAEVFDVSGPLISQGWT